MKKILILLLITPCIIGAYIAFNRISSNNLSITPYPFFFEKTAYKDLSIDAPILIIGDAMASRLSTFKNRLIDKLSINLSKPIKIATLSNEGDNIHRTLKKIKSLDRVPLIIIYLGNTDQQFELMYHTKQINKLNKNFQIFNNDYIKTLLLVFPYFSKLAYWPINYVKLDTKVNKNETIYTDQEYQSRMAVNYTLYKAALDELFNYAKKRNSLLIPITTPLNLRSPPMKSCYSTITKESRADLDKMKLLIEKKDFKSAYNLGKEITLLNPLNAQALFLYGQVLNKLNKFSESQKYNELAIAYDCQNPRGNPIYNVILRKTADKYKFKYLDFHQLLVDQSRSNFVFNDDIYPQDYYVEKIIDLLGIKIKKLLKL